MTTAGDHVGADAAALMALPADAPERARAEEHARACADCTRALAEGRRLLALIGAAPLPAPSSAALSRASAAIFADLDAQAAGSVGARKLAGAVAAAVLAAWALPLALMQAPIVADRALVFSLGLTILAAVASAATVALGGRLAGIFPVLSALTAAVAGRGSELEPLVGLHCASLEAMTALGAGAVAWLAARVLARGAAPPSLAVAAVGGGALAGHAALHVGCHAAGELPHLVVFHTGPVVLAVGLGLLLASAARRTTSRESSRR